MENITDSVFNLLEHTSCHVLLTGKAGTGKTTFLNEFAKKTTKKHLILAPTGIAAINAGGMTIHSMFNLPLRPFAPTYERVDESVANNIRDLLSHFKYRKNKIKLLREVELVVIDEVSMLRADVLDMVDFALRFARRSSLRFGGVQLLFIGDLHQLPPVVRETEKMMENYYATPFFFSAHALENTKFVTVELTKVYRQKDEEFLSILNEVREGTLSRENYENLNKRYFKDFEPSEKDSYIYLTTHNRKANAVNQKKLEEISYPSYSYESVIEGDFKENQYPNDLVLEFKQGAQVMFIRNDFGADKAYFNGKIAWISRLTKDRIFVESEDGKEFEVKKETWHQVRYSLDKDNKIVEEILGSFQQYPLRLAWAVTIHKSQGLTFDKVIVDAGEAFTSGQVYVALSRCRTLEGVVLKSKIPQSVIFNDHRVLDFQKETNANEKIKDIIEEEKFDYSIDKVIQKLDCVWIVQYVDSIYKKGMQSQGLDVFELKNLHFSLKTAISDLVNIFQKTELVLKQKGHQSVSGKIPWTEVEKKCQGAVQFFYSKIKEQIFGVLMDFYRKTKEDSETEAFNDEVSLFFEELQDYLSGFRKIELLGKKLFEQEGEEEKIISKIPTHLVTFQLFEEGKNVEQIAKERNLKSQTIYGHLAKLAEQKKFDLSKIITEEKVQIFQEIFSKTQYASLSEWKEALPDNFEFSEIRILINYFS